MKKHAEHDADTAGASEAEQKVPGSGTAETTPEAAPAASAGPADTEGTARGGAAAAQGTAKGDSESKAEASLVADLEKQNLELKDQYLRKAADFDNYRKRMIKEKQDAIDYANTNLLVDLVQILDDFDRAIAFGGAQEAGSPAAAFANGVGMIRSQLGSLLENKYGLAYYPAKGASFDPMLHEAIGTIPNPGVKEPTVAEEFTKGYKLKDRIIRVSKVMVHMPVEGQSQ